MTLEERLRGILEMADEASKYERWWRDCPEFERMSDPPTVAAMALALLEITRAPNFVRPSLEMLESALCKKDSE